MNRRRILSGIHTTIARKQGVNAVAWFTGQSFNSGTRGDVPLERLTYTQVNQAGAGLLPTRIVCPDCMGSREVTRADGAPTVCGECSGRGYVEGER